MKGCIDDYGCNGDGCHGNDGCNGSAKTPAAASTAKCKNAFQKKAEKKNFLKKKKKNKTDSLVQNDLKQKRSKKDKFVAKTFFMMRLMIALKTIQVEPLKRV